MLSQPGSMVEQHVGWVKEDRQEDDDHEIEGDAHIKTVVSILDIVNSSCAALSSIMWSFIDQFDVIHEVQFMVCREWRSAFWHSIRVINGSDHQPCTAADLSAILHNAVNIQVLILPGMKITATTFASILDQPKVPQPHLDRRRTSISNLSRIAAIDNLSKVDLSHSALSSICRLASARFLRDVDVSYTLVASLAPLDTCCLLNTLMLQHTRVHDLSPLMGIGYNIQHLNLEQTLVKDITPLATMGKLANLNLAKTRIIDITSLASCHKLRVVNIAHTNVADINALAVCSRLYSLRLDWTPIDDLSPLSGHYQLTELYLHRTLVHDLSPLRGECAQSLRILDLSDTPISKISSIGFCCGLLQLDLRHTGVRDFRPLAHCSHLRHLDLRGCDLDRARSRQILSNFNCISHLNFFLRDTIDDESHVRDRILPVVYDERHDHDQLQTLEFTHFSRPELVRVILQTDRFDRSYVN